jgi:hypothetical protein
MIFFFKKPFTIFAFLLLFSIAVAPTININVVKASQDNDLVEVTSQVCGIQGYGNTTVRLAREQYQDLEQYLVEFRARLNQTTTREEAIPIFKEAVVELDKYGLLPKGMSVERAQKLVTGHFKNKGIEHRIEKTLLRYKINDSNTSNYFCLVYCRTDGIFSEGPIVRWITNFFYAAVNGLLPQPFKGLLTAILITILAYPMLFGYLLTSINPIKIFSVLTFGSKILHSSESTPSNGWVATFGLNGRKILYNQPLWGNLPLIPMYTVFMTEAYSYPGIFGFNGIQITLPGLMFDLGFALWVDIGSTPP